MADVTFTAGLAIAAVVLHLQFLAHLLDLVQQAHWPVHLHLPLTAQHLEDFEQQLLSVQQLLPLTQQLALVVQAFPQVVQQVVVEVAANAVAIDAVRATARTSNNAILLIFIHLSLEFEIYAFSEILCRSPRLRLMHRSKDAVLKIRFLEFSQMNG
jgi:hypothetical protein